jgi:competence protein ComEC
MNKPFVFLFIALAVSIFFCEHIISGTVVLVIIFIFYFFNRKKYKDLIYFIIIFCVGFFYCFFRLNYIPPNHIKKTNYEGKNFFTFYVKDAIENTEDKIYFNGDLISIENNKEKFSNLRGKIRIIIKKNLGIKIKYGDIVKIKGTLKEPEEAENNDDFNYKKFLKYKSIYYIFYAKEQDVEKTGNKIPNYFYYFSYELKEKLLNIIYSSLPEEEAKILEGIMLGNYRVLPEEINDYFKKTGTAHILAVSGMNVGLIALIVFLILKLMHFSRKVSAFITLIFITVFAIITGADPSIIRATFMAYVVLIGYLIEYDSDLLNSLAIAGFFILLFNPAELFSVSFQLSFLATFGIIYYSGFISNHFSNISRQLSEVIFTTFTSQIFIIPVMVNTFHQISLISVVANFFIVPISSIITILGFILWIIGLISHHIALFFGASIFILIKAMVFIVKILSSIPFAAISVKSINFVFLFFYYLFFIILPHKDIDIYFQNFSVKKIIGFVLLIIFIINLCIYKKESYIYFPAIKSTAAVFIKTKNNKKIFLIGCGRDKNIKEIKNNMVLYLKKYGINIIDYLILFNLKNQDNYKIIKNNFYIKKILSNTYFDDKDIKIIPDNTNISVDKDVFLSFCSNYLEIYLKNKILVFASYLNDDFKDSKDKIIFPCCYDFKTIQNFKQNNIIINTSLIEKYYKIKIPDYIWDINKQGEKMLKF